jgi:hypothetical protein
MSVTCKGSTKTGGKFAVQNPSLGSAVESWTALLQTLAAAKPVWWKDVHVDMSEYDHDNNDAGCRVPVIPSVATALQGESESEDGPTVDLQATEQLSSSPYTANDDTVHGTAETRPLNDNDDDDDETDDDISL